MLKFIASRRPIFIPILLLLIFILLYVFSPAIQEATFICRADLAPDICSGLMQARATILSAVLALFAAYLAYGSAIKTVQIEQRHQARRRATYLHRLSVALKALPRRIMRNADIVEENTDYSKGHETLERTVKISNIEMLNDSDRENHALLSEKLVVRLYELREAISSYNIFIERGSNIYLSQPIDDEISDKTGHDVFIERMQIVRRKLRGCRKLIEEERKKIRKEQNRLF